MKNLSKDRMNQVVYNKKGDKVQIVEYVDAKNIYVVFNDDFSYTTKTSYRSFVSGSVYKNRKVSKDVFLELFYKHCPDLIYLDEYQSINKKVHVKCKICGYSFYAVANNLIRDHGNSNGCPCCSNKVVVEGINDIPTTDPWMVEYFQGGYDEAKRYTHGSEARIVPKCPSCGRLLNETYIYNIYHHKNNSLCVCSDGISYPNKFSYFTFMQLSNIIANYDREYSPDWAKPYSYDNYFEYNGLKYIVEMDGGIGHGKNDFNHKLDADGIKRDKIKDHLAKQHGIIMIRVDSENTTKIKDNFIKEVGQYIDLSAVNWNTVYKNSLSSIMKNVCEYYDNNKDLSASDIAAVFHIHKATVLRYLRTGSSLGFCTYRTVKQRREDLMNLICSLKSKDSKITIKEMAKVLNASPNTISKYLKEIIVLGLLKE